MPSRSFPGAVALGAVLLVPYLLVAFLVVQVLFYPLLGRLRPLPAVAAIAATALAAGYLNYRLGTARLLRGLEAVELSRARAPRLHARLDDLCERMAVPRPRLLVTRMDAPNALSLGGRPGAVVVDRRLLSTLDGDELAALLAHELAHLEARDALVKTLGSSLVGTAGGLVLLFVLPFGLLVVAIERLAALAGARRPPPLSVGLARAYLAAAIGVTLLLAPFTLALYAYSRRRELAADDRAAEVADPVALARALERIRRSSARRGVYSSLYVHGDERGSLTRLLATHPPMEERIERLLDRADRERGRRIPVG